MADRSTNGTYVGENSDDEPEIMGRKHFSLRFKWWELIVMFFYELVGVTVMVVVAAMTFSLNGVATSGGILVTSLSYAAVTAVMMAVGARFNAGHLNPVITGGFWFLGLDSIPQVLALFGGQLGGTFTGAGITKLLLDGTGGTGGLGTPNNTAPDGRAFAIEAVLSIPFFFVILWTSYFFIMKENGQIETKYNGMGHKHRGYKLAIMVFLVFFAIVLAGAPLTGGIYNPARYLGVAVVSTRINNDFWIWIFGPVVGGAIALLMFYLILRDPVRAVLENAREAFTPSERRFEMMERS